MSIYTITKVLQKDGKAVAYDVSWVDSKGRPASKLVSKEEIIRYGHKFTNATVSDSGLVRVNKDVPRESYTSPNQNQDKSQNKGQQSEQVTNTITIKETDYDKMIDILEKNRESLNLTQVARLKAIVTIWSSLKTDEQINSDYKELPKKNRNKLSSSDKYSKKR
jgi:hypothetical protein